MANRFPLIVNPDTKEIQEIAQNDNLDLTGNGLYAGGSLGSNGQVLTTNGTTVEWRTLTSGGGGGSGIDSDTTYIVEAEDQADGASLNLIAGGSGIGTIKIKFLDSNQLQFDTLDSLTISPSIKNSSITNDQLQYDSYTFRINGVDTDIPLGNTVVIPQYGDVFRTSTQSISNKTFTNCTMSLAGSAGNNIQSIPNSSLINSSININGTAVPLGGSITISGGGSGSDENTTYTFSAAEGLSGEMNLILTGSDATAPFVALEAGDRMSLAINNNTITFNATEVNTDSDTRYAINTDTYVVSNQDLGARLNLTSTVHDVINTTSTIGVVDRINLRDGIGVKVTSIGESDIQFSIGQDVSTTSNVTFNNVTINGGLTVEGATTYVDTTNLVVTDKTITIADGTTTSQFANNAGIYIGTSNINLVYNHNNSSWTSTSNFDLVPTKTYKIGGTVVLSSTQVLGKSMPLGDVVGTIDTQTLSNKTLNSPVISEIINTGTLYLPAPSIADTLVGRSTSDLLTNKTIDGDVNNLSNIGNSSLSNPYMIINGTQRNLGDTFTVTATDAYTDEKAQDTVAGMITSATHSGITWNYDDTAGTLSATVTAGAGAETDTLDSVTSRGNSTTNNVSFGNIESPQGNITAGNNIGGVFTGSTITADGRLTLINRIAGGNLIYAGYFFNSIQNTFVVDSNANLTLSGSLTAGGLTYPTTNGTSGEILTSDGAGNVTWGANTAPVAVGNINMNGTSPTWSGTTGYSVSGAQPGGAGTDYIYTLTFPSAYSARTDYIVHTTYDGTDWVAGNDASIGVARFTDRVEITVRRWNEDPLSLGDIMVTVYDL